MAHTDAFKQMLKKPTPHAIRLGRRREELRPFIGATIEHLDSKTRFRITGTIINAADGEVHFTYEPISEAECDRLPMARAVSEILDKSRFQFTAGDYRPHKYRPNNKHWRPRHVLEL